MLMQTPMTEQRLCALLRRLRRLAGVADDLQKRVSSTELMADSLVRDFEIVQDEFRDLLDLENGMHEGLPRPSRRRRPAPRPRLPPDSVVVKTAKIDIQMRSRGRSRVEIDGGKTLDLTPRLATLLSILASDGAPASGPMVGWKTKDETAMLMERRFGLPFIPHTIHQLTNRLRTEFENIGEPPWLVQTDRRLGMRFAVLRGGLTVIEMRES